MTFSYDFEASKRVRAFQIIRRASEERVICSWAHETWPAGLPTVAEIRVHLEAAGLWITTGKRITRLKVRGDKWLARVLSTGGLQAREAGRNDAEPAWPAWVLTGLDRWQAKCLQAGGEEAQMPEDLAASANLFLAKKGGNRRVAITGRGIAKYLRAHGFASIRKSDGVWFEALRLL